MKKILQKCKNLGWAEYILIFSIVYVLLSFVLFYLIDLRNIFNVRDFLINFDQRYFYFGYTPFFFEHYGRNSGFAELIQWAFLGGGMFLSAVLTGYFYKINKRLATFFGLLALALVLMLLEDAGDVRHTLMSYVQAVAKEPDQGFWGTGFEGLYFMILGGIPLYALIRFWSDIRKYSKFFWYLIMGFIAHGLAASLSFIGTAFQMYLDRDIYTIMGDKFVALSYYLGDANLKAVWENWNSQNWMSQINFYLMDSLIEENIELIGGAFLFAALIVFWKKVNKEKAEIFINN